MDTFTLIVTVGMVCLFLWVIALGVWHPRTGAEILRWHPTRSPDLESQNELDDVEQMIAAQNALRARRGKGARTQAEVEDQVRRDQRALADYADAYWQAERAGGPAAGDGVVVYGGPTCSKTRRVARLLAERGLDVRRVDAVPAERIAPLLAKAGLSAREALRPQEPGAAALAGADEAAILAAMVADPALLQRPLVERGDRVVLARPAERVLELL